MALERVPPIFARRAALPACPTPRSSKKSRTQSRFPSWPSAASGILWKRRSSRRSASDFIDESEVLTPADDHYHVFKHDFKVPFVCGCRDLGEALRRIGEGAAMIRTKGEAGTGDIIEAVRHMRAVRDGIARLASLRDEELMTAAKELGAPFELVWEVAKTGKLPVPNFSAGGVATPADAALMMQLGAESVFVGSGIFKSGNPERRATAIVSAVVNYRDPKVLAEISEDLGAPMVGIGLDELAENQKIAGRGW